MSLSSRKVLYSAVSMVLIMFLAGCTAPPAEDAEGTHDDTGNEVTKTFPPVKGTSLTPSDIADIQAAFDDQPLSDSQSPWPGHRIKWVTDETFIFTHWNHDDPAQADELNWIGVGVKGVFCSEDRPGPERYWRHFHHYDAENYPAGHGNVLGGSGYWLTHIAVRDFTAPWGEVGPGVDEDFMHTPAEACGAAYSTFKDNADFGGEGETIDTAGLDAIRALMDDQPLNDAQSPWPNHRIKWITEETFFFTHYPTEDPAAADAMNWYGIGLRGTFCASDRPGEEDQWRHFHHYEAENYPAGHGNVAGGSGYWLLHAGVRDFTAPWGDVGPGVDTTFMNTPAPDC